MCIDIVVRPPLTVNNPFFRTIGILILRMSSHEFLRFGPQSRYALRCIVEIDSEPVSLVMILHPAKDVIIHVAEKMYFWFDAPVVANVFEGRMFVEHAAVPPAHLVV